MSKLWMLDDLDSAVGQLRAALAQPANSDLLKAGCIQYFEFCFELAWKSIKAAAQETGLEECLSPKACLKRAFGSGWIDNEEVWLVMLESRNRMSHTYKAKDALAVYASLAEFLPAMESLARSLRASVE